MKIFHLKTIDFSLFVPLIILSIDGNTYRNECEMNRMACNSRKELIAYVLIDFYSLLIKNIDFFIILKSIDYSMDNVKKQIMKII